MNEKSTVLESRIKFAKHGSKLPAPQNELGEFLEKVSGPPFEFARVYQVIQDALVDNDLDQLLMLFVDSINDETARDEVSEVLDVFKTVIANHDSAKSVLNVVSVYLAELIRVKDARGSLLELAQLTGSLGLAALSEHFEPVYEEPGFYVTKNTVGGESVYGLIAHVGIGNLIPHESTYPERASDAAHHLKTVGTPSAPVSLAIDFADEDSQNGGQSKSDIFQNLLLQVVEHGEKKLDHSPQNTGKESGIRFEIFSVTQDLIEVFKELLQDEFFLLLDGHHRVKGHELAEASHVSSVTYTLDTISSRIEPFHRVLEGVNLSLIEGTAKSNGYKVVATEATVLENLELKENLSYIPFFGLDEAGNEKFIIISMPDLDDVKNGNLDEVKVREFVNLVSSNIEINPTRKEELDLSNLSNTVIAYTRGITPEDLKNGVIDEQKVSCFHKILKLYAALFISEMIYEVPKPKPELDGIFYRLRLQTQKQRLLTTHNL